MHHRKICLPSLRVLAHSESSTLAETVLNSSGYSLKKMRQIHYSDLPKKRTHHSKQVGRENFFVYYMKNCVQGGKICHLLHEKLLQGGFFFPKMLSEHSRLLGMSE